MSKNTLRIYSVRYSFGEEPAVLINSRYTYNHVSHFHKTVLAILLNKDLSLLSLEDLGNIEQFTHLILDLLAAPQMNYLDEDEYREYFDQLKTTVKPAKLRGKGALKRSKKCLKELLKWIAELVSKDDLTLEAVLDEYYNNFPYAQQVGGIGKRSKHHQ